MNPAVKPGRDRDRVSRYYTAMTWSFRLVRILGTDVKVHFTFVLLLGFLFLSWQQAGGVDAALQLTGLFLALFFCIVLHEFGHILMARHFGIRTPDVVILPIGGVARLERVPEVPRQELLIALAGPLVTAAIAVGLAAWLVGRGELITLTNADELHGSLALDLLQANVILLFFNLIPAFPLDGGRVFRALLAMRMPHLKATRLAAKTGQALAIGGGLYGLATGQTWLMVVALFVFLSAGQELASTTTRVAGAGILVDQMMITRFRTLPVYATLREAVDLLLEGEQGEFPVVDNLGSVEGLLTRDHLIRGLTARGPDSPVAEAMAKPVARVPLGLPFEAALTQLRESGLPALPVVDAAGQLTGLLTMNNITDLILVRQAVAPR